MKRKLIVILGPTASGKTAFSLSLARYLPLRGRMKEGGVEIINADSRQLYKYMDIGTAKICPDEMCGIPHHLFSVLDPSEEVNIAWYKEHATRIIDEVHARGNIPMLVGGSMLYISVIIDGLQPILRTLSHGRPSRIKSPCPYDLRIIGMQISRQECCRRINGRVATLLMSGWIEEVEGLLKMGYTPEDPGFKACGYREIAEHVALRRAQGDMSTLCELICTKTRQYAKRQMTWWKNDERIRWINPETADFQSLFASLQDLAMSVPRRDSVHPLAL